MNTEVDTEMWQLWTSSELMTQRSDKSNIVLVNQKIVL